MTRAIKDSGVEWIGDVPEEWDIVKNKLHLTFINGRAYKDDELLPDGKYRVLRVGNFNTNEKWFYSDLELEPKKYCQSGDLLYLWATTYGPQIWNDEKVIFHYHIWKVLLDDNCIKKYVFYSLEAASDWMRLQSHGSTMTHITKNWIENYFSTYPSLAEQHDIADYLDVKCAQIDGTIARCNDVANRLDDYKKSLICHCVTKGMDESVAMKDSGIEWIGEIPAAWKTKRFDLLASPVQNKNVGLAETNLLSLSYGNIVRKNIDNAAGLVPESYEGYNIIDAGDTVLRFTDLQNDKRSLRTGLAKERGIITSAYLTVRPFKNIVTPEFLHYVLHAYDLQKLFYNMGSGVRQSLDWRGVNRIFMPLPDLSEQQAITDYLDAKCSQIDEAIERHRAIAEKLATYRKSIIYQAVTGKIDCRKGC